MDLILDLVITYEDAMIDVEKVHGFLPDPSRRIILICTAQLKLLHTLIHNMITVATIGDQQKAKRKSLW